METLLSVFLGLGLSAACGFRVFIPLLVMSIAAHSGHLDLASGFDWIGSDVGLATFAVATCLEIGGYFIPWLDNALDTIATPAAIVAGTIVTASVVTDMSPLLKWTLAVIAGGGAAGAVQATTVATRAISTAGTGGLANPLFATVELAGSAFTSVLALLLPIITGITLIVLVTLAVLHIRSRKQKAAQPLPPQLAQT